MKELQKDVLKILKTGNTDNIEDVKAEIAYVSVVLEQLVGHLKINKKELRKIKIERLNKIKEYEKSCEN